MNMFKIRKPMNMAESQVRSPLHSRDTLENNTKETPDTLETCQENMGKLMTMFESFMKQSLENNSQHKSQYNQ